MSFREKALQDLDREREVRERARNVLSSGTSLSRSLTHEDLSSQHYLHPYRCRRPIYNCLLPLPLAYTLALSSLELVHANQVGAEVVGEEEDETLVGAIVDVLGKRVRVPDLPTLQAQALRVLPRPFLLASGMDLVSRLLERGAAALLSNGSDADRGSWSREQGRAADEAHAVCVASGVTGWAASFTTARYLLVDVVPRISLIQCLAGIIVDHCDLYYEMCVSGRLCLYSNITPRQHATSAQSALTQVLLPSNPPPLPQPEEKNCRLPGGSCSSASQASGPPGQELGHCGLPRQGSSVQDGGGATRGPALCAARLGRRAGRPVTLSAGRPSHSLRVNGMSVFARARAHTQHARLVYSQGSMRLVPLLHCCSGPAPGGGGAQAASGLQRHSGEHCHEEQGGQQASGAAALPGPPLPCKGAVVPSLAGAPGSSSGCCCLRGSHAGSAAGLPALVPVHVLPRPPLCKGAAASAGSSSAQVLRCALVAGLLAQVGPPGVLAPRPATGGRGGSRGGSAHPRHASPAVGAIVLFTLHWVRQHSVGLVQGLEGSLCAGIARVQVWVKALGQGAKGRLDGSVTGCAVHTQSLVVVRHQGIQAGQGLAVRKWAKEILI